MDPNRFDPNYPRRYPQDLPRWRRVAMWVIIVVAIADVVYVGVSFVARPANVVLAMFGLIIVLLDGAAAGLALNPPPALSLKDFAKNCSNFALWTIGLGVVISVCSTVGELYLW